MELRGISIVLLMLRWPPAKCPLAGRVTSHVLLAQRGLGMLMRESEHPDMEEMGTVFSLSFSDQEQQPHPGRGSGLGN